MLEKAFAVTADEIQLMLAASFVHHPDVIDRMRLRHFREELVE
jgi:hypothetical protein